MSYFDQGNSMQRTTPVVLNLIIINAIVFLLQNVVTAVDIQQIGSLYYYKSSFFRPYQFVTYMFLHANFTHILFNMYGLWLFGTMLERFLGPKKFFLLYFISGIGAAIFVEILTPYDAIQAAKNLMQHTDGQLSLSMLVDSYKENSAALGASGAIMGLYGAFGYLFPNTEFYLFFIPIPIKAKYLITVFVLIDLFGGLYRIQGDNIAHFAHLGGAIVGFLVVLIWNKTNRNTFY